MVCCLRCARSARRFRRSITASKSPWRWASICSSDWRPRRIVARLRRLAALLPWIALAALLIAPFAVPYLRVRSELGLERSIGETLQNAATLAEYLRPPIANPVYRVLPGLASAESGLFPGLVVLALAVLGAITWRVLPKWRDADERGQA